MWICHSNAISLQVCKLISLLQLNYYPCVPPTQTYWCCQGAWVNTLPRWSNPLQWNVYEISRRQQGRISDFAGLEINYWLSKHLPNLDTSGTKDFFLFLFLLSLFPLPRPSPSPSSMPRWASLAQLGFILRSIPSPLLKRQSREDAQDTQLWAPVCSEAFAFLSLTDLYGL